MKILLAEDEKATRDGVCAFLKEKGYDVITARDGEEAINSFREADMVLLDIMMPKMNGMEILEEIRRVSDVPVIMLTAITDEPTQLASFDNLADDYVSKPFSLKVLIKRIENLSRRLDTLEDIWKYGNAVVDFSSFQGSLDGKDAELKPMEIRILKLLIENKGIVLSRNTILERLWNDEDVPFDRVVDVYIKNLRKKLQLDCIKTVKGVGYRYDEA